MKKRIIMLVSLVLCLSMGMASIASAGIFDDIGKTEETSQSADGLTRLVSYTAFKGVYPDEITATEDGGVSYLYEGIAEIDFYEFGDYLEEQGWSVNADSVKQTENGYEMSIEKDGQSVQLVYDDSAWEMTLTYGKGYAGKYAYDKGFIGSYVTFGHYPHNADGKDKTGIEWLVLDIDYQKGTALLISRYGLNSIPYNTVEEDTTWEKCSLRTWLNNDFLNRAFTENERNVIADTEVDNTKAQGNPSWNTDGGKNTTDKIFLLSYVEANTYFANDNARMCVPTDYAIQQGAWTNDAYKVDGKASCVWWLRSPGSSSSYAAYVRLDGALGGNDGVGDGDVSVRPALWVNLDSGIF